MDRKRYCHHRLGLCVALAWALAPTGLAAGGELIVGPAAIVLDTPEASQQVLATDRADDGRLVDVTRTVTYEVLDPAVAAVDSTGLVEPRSEGGTQLFVRQGEQSVSVPLEVRGLGQPAPISFEHQIIPILTKAGCNSGGCHGKAEGQNGFKLSVFGFDPAADHRALAMEGRGRRLFVPAPEHSLLLRKASGVAPHGGGLKIAADSWRYRRIVRWIAEGARPGVEGVLPAVAIEVEPRERILAFGGTQQLRVTAVDAEGGRRCVTTEAEFSSNAGSIADADGRGWITAANIPGEAAVLVRYMGHVAVCRITLPRLGVEFVRPAEANFIDTLVWDKLAMLGIAPSEAADDATFLRRVYLDTIGTLPTAAEARGFLASTAPDKRARLIDTLLERPEYADYWTMRWSDILRVDKDSVTPQGAVAMTRWLRRQFAQNRPYDQFAREILLAQGDSTAEGPASFYKVLNTPELLSRSVSQVFLGVRIECAQCHHHPFEKWGQDDYFALAGFFTGLGRKPLAGGAEAIFAMAGTDLKHPRTDLPVPTKALAAAPVDLASVADRRVALADWMVAGDNGFFAPTIANRLWAHYFGRGLVEPIDDLRATNPATNEPLLARLAQHLHEVRFDLKAFTRTLLNSNVYAISSLANESNADDQQNFSHATQKALPAEVLLDAICQTTEVPEKFIGWPSGYRAIQVWDNRLPSYFFQIFGRPVRASVCECERSSEPSIAQALHLMNAPEIMAKLQSRHGRARRMAKAELSDREVIDELYLAALSRFPTQDEVQLVQELFDQTKDRRAATEDLLWALMNSKEFIYNH